VTPLGANPNSILWIPYAGGYRRRSTPENLGSILPAETFSSRSQTDPHERVFNIPVHADWRTRKNPPVGR
jgi:hypothetical protein